MGWPPCMWEGCNNWPAVGHTGVCRECIKDPVRVEEIADKMYENWDKSSGEDLAASCMIAWMGREPNGRCVELVLEEIKRDPKVKIREAIERARRYYWSTWIKKNDE